jgi:hypothetical protein
MCHLSVVHVKVSLPSVFAQFLETLAFAYQHLQDHQLQGNATETNPGV